VEELTEENICDTSNTLKFTTPLKYKGLEQQNVFMVLNKISDFNQYEAYVGCTRAISNLQIITI
jgi:superfamily I DNA/RNA helicase